MSKPLWTITKLEDTTTFSPGTGAVPSKRVTFELFDGTSSSLTIPDTVFSANEVNKRVDAMAKHMLEVLNLQGQDIPVGDNVQPYQQYGVS